MKELPWHLVYCKYCTLDFSGNHRPTVEASRNAHEEVCHKNPDVAPDREI